MIARVKIHDFQGVSQPPPAVALPAVTKTADEVGKKTIPAIASVSTPKGAETKHLLATPSVQLGLGAIQPSFSGSSAAPSARETTGPSQSAAPASTAHATAKGDLPPPSMVSTKPVIAPSAQSTETATSVTETTGSSQPAAPASTAHATAKVDLPPPSMISTKPVIASSAQPTEATTSVMKTTGPLQSAAPISTAHATAKGDFSKDPKQLSNEATVSKVQILLKDNQFFTDHGMVIDVSKSNLIGGGSYGKVIQAKLMCHPPIDVVIKIKKVAPRADEIYARETSTLCKLTGRKITNIVQLCDTITDSKHVIFSKYSNASPHYGLVFRDEGISLSAHINNLHTSFTKIEIHRIAVQLLSTLNELHAIPLSHNDLSPGNVVIDRDQLRLIDFANALPPGLITEDLAARWYRAPEYFVGQYKFNCAVDIWGAACVLCEIVRGKPLFPGSSDKETLINILREIGLPDEEFIIKSRLGSQLFLYRKTHVFSNDYLQAVGSLRVKIYGSLLDKGAMQDEADAFIDLISKMLVWDPNKRITAEQALQHPYITQSYKKPAVAAATTAKK